MPSTDKPSTLGLCANANGFSLHAGGALWRRSAQQLEHVCRYIARPAIANQPLLCHKRD
jgi:hypothetical protein